MIKNLSMVILFMFRLCIFGQEQENKMLPISVSYYGDNLIHPGLKVGTTYTFKSYQKFKVRRLNKRQIKMGNKIKYKQLMIMGSVGGYSHPNNDIGLFMNTGFGYERVKSGKGNLFGVNLELGYLRTFNRFKTLSVNPAGGIELVSLAGQNSVMLTLSPVFGRDLSIRRDIPLKWYVKPGIQLLKYNHGWFPNAVFEAETIFYLKGGKNEK